MKSLCWWKIGLWAQHLDAQVAVKLLSPFATMAFRTLSFLLLVVAQAKDASPETSQGALSHVDSTNETSSTWSNFVHCKCGLSCVKQMGSWYIFNVGQSCACEACPEASSTSLRGKNAGSEASLPKDSQEPAQQSAESFEKISENKNLKSMPIPAESLEKTWDSAMVPGTNLLYCTSA